MSLFGLYKTAPSPSRSDIDDALAGNLCRCTGYRPIVEAAKRMYALPPPSGWRGNASRPDGDDDDVETALSADAPRALRTGNLQAVAMLLYALTIAQHGAQALRI